MRALEAAFDEIRREINTLADSVFQPESEGLDGTEGWDVLLLYERGHKNAENCARCPVITRIIESHARCARSPGSCMSRRPIPGLTSSRISARPTCGCAAISASRFPTAIAACASPTSACAGRKGVAGRVRRPSRA
ncbi:MAG: aspartyl/asparaginyl beta-hydroxylase domain-containing protein [Pseudomonadota bacterium]